MADELDARLEQRLRSALRAEADGLPFDVREQDLEAAHRARRWRRGLMAAGLAAAVVIAGIIGLGAVSLIDRSGPVAATPSPSPTLRPLDNEQELLALIEGYRAQLLSAEGSTPADAAAPKETDLGPVTITRATQFAVSCLGGNLTFVIRGSDGSDIDTHQVGCSLSGPFSGYLTGPFGDPPAAGSHLVVIAPPGMRWRVVVAEGAPDTRSLVTVGCAQIRDAGQARSFIVKNIAAGLDYGDELTSNVALRVEPGSWPLGDLAPLAADSQGALGFDVGSHCVRSWDLSFATVRDVQAALDAGTEPQLATGPVTTASDNHSLRTFGLPVGDLVVRVVVTWDTVPGLDLTDTYLLHLTVLPPVPGASGDLGYPDPTVPCAAVDATTPAPPMPGLYLDGTRVGLGATWSSTWHGTADDGVPMVPQDAIGIASGTGLEVRIAGDACAKLWLVRYAQVPADRLLTDAGTVLARQDNPTLDPAFARENRIALADLPAGDWAVSVHLVFEGGSSDTLFRVRVGG